MRTKQTKELVQELLASFATVADVRLEVVDDIDLELAIGRAVEQAGPQHRAEVYPRSMLGEVTLFGRAPTVATVEEMKRVVAQVPGVMSVNSRMIIGALVTPAATPEHRLTAGIDHEGSLDPSPCTRHPERMIAVRSEMLGWFNSLGLPAEFVSQKDPWR